MSAKRLACKFLATFLCIGLSGQLAGQVHEILFCGEKIPVSSGFVSDKLMNVIKKQIRFINLSDIRNESKKYFPGIEQFLKSFNLPLDFKYLAIVESAFKNAVSKAGAAGFWQLMRPTAIEKGLIVNDILDERNDINKATYVACQVLAQYYKMIHKKFGIYSWVLATAAYNNGIGNITKKIISQGTNYFEMQLNGETASYVYKIIAVKELFEYPELYMKDFGYNVFASRPAPQLSSKEKLSETDSSSFASIRVNVRDEKDSRHPDDINLSAKPGNSVVSKLDDEEVGPVKYIGASIRGKYRNFQDGDLVTVELQEELQIKNNFYRKGKNIKGRGWIIDGKVLIDLDFGRSVTLYDENSEKGVFISSLKNGVPVLLKVINSNE